VHRLSPGDELLANGILLEMHKAKNVIYYFVYYKKLKKKTFKIKSIISEAILLLKNQC